MSLSGRQAEDSRCGALPVPTQGWVSGSLCFCFMFQGWCFHFSFPETWHWGAWNGSTCCNRTCGLLLVAKILQQPLHYKRLFLDSKN